MESLAFFTGLMLPPITIIVFVAAMVYRFRAWSKAPKPKMTLFPAPETPGKAFFGVLKATFLFPGVFKTDKFLWVGSWIFHAMLALILVGHTRAVVDFPGLWAALRINPDKMSAIAGGAAGLMSMSMLLLLLIRRFSVPRVRLISNGGDYFALFLVLAILLTGNAMRFVSHFELAQAREYFQGLFALTFPLPPMDPWFLLHFLLGQILLIYIPFSKILHFGGVFFTESLLQRR